MRRLYNKYAVIVTAILFSSLASCNERVEGISLEADYFVKRESPGLVQGKNYSLLYRESSWQIVRNKQRQIWRMQSDDQSSYLQAQIKEQGNTGEEYTVNVVLTYKKSSNSPENTEAMEMVILKSQEMRVWLWSEENKTGVIIPL